MERQRRADALGLCSASGESGSGKTEATKLILRCLAAMNQRRDVMQQVRPTIQPSCGCPVCLGSLAQHPWRASLREIRILYVHLNEGD